MKRTKASTKKATAAKSVAKKTKLKAVAPAKVKKAAKSAPAPVAVAAGQPKPDSKGGIIIGLITRPEGANLPELMKATDWQAHSVRGFLSTASKKYNLTIVSTKAEGGRHYSAAGPTQEVAGE